MDEPDAMLLAEIVCGAKLLFDNAQALYDEAQLLGTHGHFARALCLHQISMEECSKIDMLGKAAMGMFMGRPVDLEKLRKRMAEHKVKNYNNAYFLGATEAERMARKSGDWGTARELFRRQQEAFHKELNGNKNASLYVDWVEERFMAPAGRISETLAAETQQLNGFFLNQGALHVRLLQRFIAEPDVVDTRLKTFIDSVKELKEVAPSELEDRFMAMLDEWLDKHLSTKSDP